MDDLNVTEDAEISELIEKLAEYAHTAWSGWMQYLFEKSLRLVGNQVVIPEKLVERWMRKMQTAYADLPEKEKDSDRKEAMVMLSIMLTSGAATEDDGSEIARLTQECDRLIAENRSLRG